MSYTRRLELYVPSMPLQQYGMIQAPLTHLRWQSAYVKKGGRHWHLQHYVQSIFARIRAQEIQQVGHPIKAIVRAPRQDVDRVVTSELYVMTRLRGQTCSTVSS
jgi:hypothetical protein